MSVASGRKRKNATASPDRAPPDPVETSFVGDIRACFEDLRTQFLEYVALRIARLKLSLWQKILGLAALVLGAVSVVAFLVMAVVLCFSGVAGGIGEATGRPWLGSLVAGGGGLVVAAIAFLVARGILRRKAERKAGECLDEKHV